MFEWAASVTRRPFFLAEKFLGFLYIVLAPGKYNRRENLDRRRARCPH